MLANLIPDLRIALRTFAKSPLFVAVALLSLALGIGANTAIFTLTDQVLLRLLPVQHPEQLVFLSAVGQHYGSNMGTNRISYPMYQDFRDHNTVFSGMFCFSETVISVTDNGRTERVAGELVSGNYFPVLGVRAAIGRLFTAADDLHAGAHPFAVLSYGYWRTRFGGDPSVVGRKILVNGYPLTIIGVSSSNFSGTDPAFAPEVRVPIMMRPQLNTLGFYDLWDRRGRWVTAFARLKPGVDLQQAKASLQPFFHQITNREVQEKPFARASAESKQAFLRMSMDVQPAGRGRSQLRRQFATPLLVLMATVALVLLIACANVANLLIARATSRQKEIAVRLALGATRTRIVAQLLTESMLLAVVGGLAGIALALWIDHALIGFFPPGETRMTVSPWPDTRIFLFNLAITILTGVIFGLVPALQGTRPNLAPTLKDQAGSLTSAGSVNLRKALVVAQVAFSLLLLIGAGLFVRSLRNLQALDPGFHTNNLLSFKIDPTINGNKPARSMVFYRRFLENTRRIPDAQAVSLAIMPILENNEWDSSVTIDTYKPKRGENVGPHMNFISADYFKTLGAPLLAGRDFRASDIQGAPPVAIVNERFAKKYFGSTNAIGHRIGMGGDPGTKTDITIVGVSGDIKYEGMRDEVPVEVFRPFEQVEFVLSMVGYIRTARDPNQTFANIRKTARNLDPNVPVYEMATIESVLDNSLITERLVATLSAAFGLIATVLAAIGLYGVMAYTVARRTREIGIRVAIGAARVDVVWLVMREVLLLLAIGIAIALPAAFLLTRWVQSQLYGMQANDPVSIVLATLGITVVAALAGYIPARRATEVDPMSALRYE